MKILLLILVLSFGAFGQTNKDVKMIYWSADKTQCDICDSFTIDDNKFYIFDTPEMHLAFSGTDNGKFVQISVALFNKSNTQRIEFNPTESVLALYVKEGDKIPVELHPIAPELVAKKIGCNPKLKNFFTLFLAGLATQQTRINSATSGSATIVGMGGMASGNYNEKTTSIVTAPNHDVQNQARQTVAERNADAKALSDSILRWAMRANTVLPQKELIGNIYFERKQGVSMYVGIKVGSSLYLQAFKYSN